MMNRRFLLAVIAVSLGGLVALALLPSNRGQPPMITVLGEDSSNLTAYSTAAKAFEKQSGIKVQVEAATFEQAVQKADASFRSGSATYDVVLQYNFSLATYVRGRFVTPIDELFQVDELAKLRKSRSFFERALKETSYYYSNPDKIDGPPSQFGLPFAANTLLLVYNKDLFESPQHQSAFKEKHGRALTPPATWADYMVVAEYFSQPSTNTKGVAMQGAPDGWLYYEAALYLFNMGTGTTKKEFGWEEVKSLTIATVENERVLEYMKRLREFSSGDFFSVGASQQQEIMLEGKTAMALMWSDYVQRLAEAGQKDAKKSRFGFSPTPGSISGLAGGAFYVDAKSKNKRAAADFIEYITRPQVQEGLISHGLCSPVKEAYTESVLKTVPYADSLRASLERGVFMFEAGRDSETINTAVTTNIQKFMRGEIDARSALINAQEQVAEFRRTLK